MTKQKSAKQKSDKRKSAASPATVNTPHGQRGNYVKVSVTLPPDLFERVSAEAVRRKLAGEKDARVSAIVREALAAFLDGAGAGRLPGISRLVAR